MMHAAIRTFLRVSALLLVALLLPTSAALAQSILRYATISETPALDVQVTTADVTALIGLHMFETLYAFDASFAPQPQLAAGEKLLDGGKTIVITLRQGVPFHNGKEMTSEDVVASLKRWGEFGARGKLLMEAATALEATGKYDVTLKLSAPNGAWKSLLANMGGGPAIYPAESVGKAGAGAIDPKSLFGTGVFRFNEWRPNRYVELIRFDKYASVNGKPDGYAGAHAAKVDAIRFMPVPDVGTRVSGVQAGDYDYAEFISGDLYDTLKANRQVVIQRSAGPLFGLFFMNSKEGILKDNFKLRRAIQMALNKEEALRVSFGPEALWSASGSIFPKGNLWYSEAGTAAYNQHDAAKAKALAIEAGYTGTPIRLLVSTNYQTHYDQATVFTKQLAAAGNNVQLIVVDWATLLKMRGESDKWDIFVTHHGFVPDPILLTPLNDSYPGWWATPEKAALKKPLIEVADVAARKKAWDGMQALFYEQVPVMKVGDGYSYDIASPKLKGLSEHTVVGPHFWNVSK
jgi:peptide/nickel transport system substrate-binding protein